MAAIIGIDCATEEKRVGLAYARWESGSARIEQITTGGRGEPVAEIVAGWASRKGPVLLALDAPLGWPAPLAENLGTHSAGSPIQEEANRLFRRETDRFVRQVVGRQPLDVGADRIARTALAALNLLAEIRARTGQSIPLAWQPEESASIRAVEVYPAATLLQHNLPAAGYKRGPGETLRQEILAGLDRLLGLPEDLELARHNADALDAMVCVLAGADFLAGRGIAPQDSAAARKEGWIWIRHG